MPSKIDEGIRGDVSVDDDALPTLIGGRGERPTQRQRAVALISWVRKVRSVNFSPRR